MSAKQIQSQIQRHAKSSREKVEKFGAKAEEWRMKAQNQRVQLGSVQDRDEATQGRNLRQGYIDDSDSDSSYSSDSSGGGGGGGGRKAEKKRAKQEKKAEKKLRRLEKKADKKGARFDRKVGKQSAKDEKKVGKMKFIVIENI